MSANQYVVKIEKLRRTEEHVGLLPWLKTKHVREETEEVYHQIVDELDIVAVVQATNGVGNGKARGRAEG